MSTDYNGVLAHGVMVERQKTKPTKTKIGNHNYPETMNFDPQTGKPLWQTSDEEDLDYDAIYDLGLIVIAMNKNKSGAYNQTGGHPTHYFVCLTMTNIDPYESIAITSEMIAANLAQAEKLLAILVDAGFLKMGGNAIHLRQILWIT